MSNLVRARLIGSWLLLASAFPAAADLDGVHQAGRLRVLVVQRADEFYTVSPQGESGFDREILEAFALRQSVRVETVPVAGWNEVFDALLGGKGDLIAGHLTVTEDRQRRVAFTEEVFPTRNVIVTYAPHRVVSSVDQLKSETVGTVRGTSLADAIHGAGVPRERIVDSAAVGTLPDLLKRGVVSAVVFGVEGAIGWQRRDPNIQLGGFIGPRQSLAYALRKEDVALRAALDQHLRELRASGRWNMLVVKYFGSEAARVLRQARQD